MSVDGEADVATTNDITLLFDVLFTPHAGLSDHHPVAFKSCFDSTNDTNVVTMITVCDNLCHNEEAKLSHLI